MTARNKNAPCGLLLFLSLSSAAVWADPNLEEIQRQFNQETISKPFNVPDDASLTTSLKAATDRGTPTRTPGGYVAPNIPLLGGFGYTGGYMRPYYGGYYGGGYSPFYGGWW
ncbi:hypothetical protein [Nitrosovibrio tenuis]|uniref:PXPV repeat-containing protein n=1 Tax=Nitrosovibrio tenuis TaxID=1233 RepID=A0A1H7NN74_9PROT|nr:hypothetical protein [Nitrosovibrio tenuis]SEL24458.1 hypothetical protein SAMN05216387_10766 [Nitrosovibrio tenuis]